MFQVNDKVEVTNPTEGYGNYAGAIGVVDEIDLDHKAGPLYHVAFDDGETNWFWEGELSPAIAIGTWVRVAADGREGRVVDSAVLYQAGLPIFHVRFGEYLSDLFHREELEVPHG